MPVIQFVFIALVIVLLAALLVDGALKRSVWIKGARDGLFSFRHWAHRRSLDEDPWLYWFAMGFYSLALLCLCGFLLLG